MAIAARHPQKIQRDPIFLLDLHALQRSAGTEVGPSAGEVRRRKVPKKLDSAKTRAEESLFPIWVSAVIYISSRVVWVV